MLYKSYTANFLHKIINNIILEKRINGDENRNKLFFL